MIVIAAVLSDFENLPACHSGEHIRRHLIIVSFPTITFETIRSGYN